MKAMILGAGQGTRVAPFTHTVPKPLLPVAGTPVIDQLLAFLRRQGISDVMINTAYLADTLMNYVGDGSRYRMDVTYNFEGVRHGHKLIGQPKGSAGGLRDMQVKTRAFDSTFIVLCGDAIIDFDLEQAVRFHVRNRALATIVAARVPAADVERYGVICSDSSGRILGFQEKPTRSEARSNLVSTGIYIFEPEIFQHIPAEGSFDIGSQLFPHLLETVKAPIYACQPSLQWIDIGTVHDYWQAQLKALYGDIWHFPMKGNYIKDGVRASHTAQVPWDDVHVRGPVYIASGARIEPNVKIIGPAIIGANAVIGKDSKLHNVIVGDNVKIENGSALERLWLTTEFNINLSNDRDTAVTERARQQVSDARALFDDERRIAALR